MKSITVCLLLLTYSFLLWFYIFFLKSKYLQLFCVILYSCFLFHSFTARFRSIILNCNTQIYLKALSIFWAFSILGKSLCLLCLDVIIFALSGLHKPRSFTLQFNRLYTNELILPRVCNSTLFFKYFCQENVFEIFFLLFSFFTSKTISNGTSFNKLKFLQIESSENFKILYLS